MSRKLKKIITIILCALLAFIISYFSDIKKPQHQLTILRKKQTRLENKLHDKQTQTDSSIILQQQIAKLNTSYTTYKKQLNLAISIPLLLDQLAKIAKFNKVRLKTIQPLPLKQKDWLTMYPMRFVLLGNYHQLSKFVKSLVNTLYFVALPKVKLSKIKNNNHELTMQAFGIIYTKSSKDKN